ncbi:thioredoxin family protein [Patescibacteria group bacterium]|nr:thioredoxin family protein [Patescibacteria group bacterium]
MKEITLTELTSPGCTICKAFEELWHSIEGNWSNVKYQNVSITTPEGAEIAQKYMIMSSPGIILNDELWAMGGFDKDKFVAKLKELSS